MKVSQLAARHGVTPQTIRNWRRIGMPVEDEAAEAWIKTNRDLSGTRRFGGRRRGAGRKPRARQNGAAGVETTTNDAGRRPVPTSAAEIARLAANGTLTAAAVGLAADAAKLRRQLREELEAEGRLLDAEEVERVWARALSTLRTHIEQLGARLAARLQRDLGLSVAQYARARTAIEDDAGQALTAMGEALVRGNPVTPPRRSKDARAAAGAVGQSVG